MLLGCVAGACCGITSAALNDDDENWKGATWGSGLYGCGVGSRKTLAVVFSSSTGYMGYASSGKYGGQASSGICWGI